MPIRIDAVEDELVVLKRIRLRAIDTFGRPVGHDHLGDSHCCSRFLYIMYMCQRRCENFCAVAG